MSKKILYLSCHSVLEYLEVSMFHNLGYEIFSPGAYVEPINPGDPTMRPGINVSVNSDIRKQYDKIGAKFPGEDGKNHLTKEFVDNFDVVIVMHMPRWIELNWHAMKHKPVIWRTIGQSIASTEQNMRKFAKQGMKIVRYSPKEYNIPYFAGQDGLIRFGMDLDDFGPWNGTKKQVITFAQSMEQRGGHCNYNLFERVTRQFPRKLFGPGNNQPGFGMGKVPYEQLKQELRDNRVYFYTGTRPASYTLNFMEAYLSGTPIVAIGPQHGNAAHLRNHQLYEVDSLIKNEVTGFVSDDEKQLKSYIKQLLVDDSLAKRISTAGRQEAIKHFNIDMISKAWDHFLKRL